MCNNDKKNVSFLFEQLDYTEPAYLMGSLVTDSASMWVPYTALLLHAYLFLSLLINSLKGGVLASHLPLTDVWSLLDLGCVRSQAVSLVTARSKPHLDQLESPDMKLDILGFKKYDQNQL